MTRLVVTLFVIATLSCNAYAIPSASEVVGDIYRTCLSQFSLSCAKPKALAWISAAINEDQIKLTNDLTIIRTGNDDPTEFNEQRSAEVAMMDRIDNFLATHTLNIEVPEILKINEARSLVSDSNLEAIQVPLASGNIAEGRGFVKKIMIPFVLGLKFKTAVLVPLTIALIALKTWKAVTLGLLSLVLAGAMVIFKLAKPKIVNYEVVHYPHHHHDHHDHHLVDHHDHHLIDHHDHHDHHVDHHLEHIAHPPPGWETHGWARQMDAQNLAYSGQR